MKSKLLLFIQLLLILFVFYGCGADPAYDRLGTTEVSEPAIPQAENLFKAIESNDSEVIKAYIKAKQDINILNGDGDTAVLTAVKNGSDEILKRLIRAYADLDIGNPLGYALDNKLYTSAALLYTGGAIYKDGDLLEHAINNRISPLAAALITAGAECDAEELLYYTIKSNLPDVAVAIFNKYNYKVPADKNTLLYTILKRYPLDLSSEIIKILNLDSIKYFEREFFCGHWTPLNGFGPNLTFNEDGSCLLEFSKDFAGHGMAAEGTYRIFNGSSKNKFIEMNLWKPEMDEYGNITSSLPLTETIQINFLSNKRMEFEFIDSDSMQADKTWVVTQKLSDVLNPGGPEEELGYTPLMEYCADIDVGVLNMWDMYFGDPTIEEINEKDFEGRNALLWTQMFYPATVKIEDIIRTLDILIEAGIDVACRDDYGKNIYDYIEALYYDKKDSKYLDLIEFLEPYKNQINGDPVVNTTTSRFLNAENIPVESIDDIKMHYPDFDMPEDPGYWLQAVVEKQYMYNRTDKCFAFMGVTVNNSLQVTAISPTGREFTHQFSHDELAIYKSTNSYEAYEDYEGNPLPSPIRTFDLDIDIDFVPGDWRIQLYPDGASTSIDYAFDTRSSGGVTFGFQGSRSPFEPAGEIVVPSGKKMIFAGKNLEPECSYKLGLFYKAGDNQETNTYTLRAKLAAYGETDSNGNFTLELDMQNDLTDQVYYMGDGQDEYSASWFLPKIVMDPAIAAREETHQKNKTEAPLIPERLTGRWENAEYNDNHTNTTIVLSNTGACIYKADKESPKHYGTFEYNEDITELVLYLTDPDGTEYQLKLCVDKYGQNLPMYNPDLDIEYTKID